MTPTYRSIETPGPSHALEHALGPVIPALARHSTRRALERDPLYRRVRDEIDRVLHGFEWDLTLAGPAPSRPASVRAVAWNVERGKRFAPLERALLEHPRLQGADLLLLTELDVGMGRSDNRNVPRALAHVLGCNYVFANYHLVLSPGDLAERDHGVPNTLALHGAALLSRWPITRFAALTLPEYRDKFHALEKRLGNKRALFVEVLLPDGPLVVVVVHLDPFAGPGHRAYQAELVAQGLARFGGTRVLLGGDLNTHTYDLGSTATLALNVAHKLLRFGFAGTVQQYLTPDHVFERGTFEALRRAGLGFDAFGDATRGTVYYDLRDPEVVGKSLERVPPFVLRWLRRRLEPWDGVVPLRFDWFAGRGLRVVDVATIERPRFDGQHVSDHNPIAIELAVNHGAATGTRSERSPR